MIQNQKTLRKIFIQSNKKQAVGALVSKHSILRNIKKSPSVDVEILVAENYPELMAGINRPHLRSGKKMVWRNDLQSFTPTRFLPPQLMGYEGKALVIDPDVFSLTDINELLDRDMGEKAILCRKVKPADGRPEYWGTSVMLLDCKKLHHWNWSQQIHKLFSLELDYQKWMTLQYEDQGNIGVLEDEWNHFDILNEKTKLLHMTSRLTQPWKTGLRIDFSFSHMKGKGKVPEKPSGIIKRFFSPKPKNNLYQNSPEDGFYQPHPDPEQEKFFFRLLRECLDEKVISEDFLKNEIRAQNLREDALSLVARLGENP